MNTRRWKTLYPSHYLNRSLTNRSPRRFTPEALGVNHAIFINSFLYLGGFATSFGFTGTSSSRIGARLRSENNRLDPKIA
jgi:hypothetical protein